jgi:hypothetical protein
MLTFHSFPCPTSSRYRHALFHMLIALMMEAVRMCETYIFKTCKRRFCHKYPSVRVPAVSKISELVKKVFLRQEIHKTECFHLWPYKISQVQVIAEGYFERRTHFCNWFLWAVHDGVLDSDLTFTHEAWFHQSGYISAQSCRCWSSINLIKTF